MAPNKQQVKASESQSRSESQSMDDSQSQEPDNTKFNELIRLRKDKERQRRQERKKRIEETANQRSADLEEKVDQCVAKYHRDVAAIRRENLERLVKLYEASHKTEAKLKKCASELERMTTDTARQLEVALNGRLEDLV